MANPTRIAIVDDEQDMRQSISQWLALSGYDTETYASAEEALKGIGPDIPVPGHMKLQTSVFTVGNDRRQKSGLAFIADGKTESWQRQ